MNKLDIPTGNTPGSMSHRNLGLGLNNNLMNTNTINNIESINNVRKPSIDESNVQDELKDKLN